MIFDRVMTRDESAGVLGEVQRMLTAERFHARGLIQSHDRVTQCHVEVDKPAEQWFISFEGGTVHGFRDGTTTHGSEPARPGTGITDGLIDPVSLAFPEKLMMWGQGSHSARPILAERIGSHSVLITFEHGADPSLRSTLVVNTELGLIERVIRFGVSSIVLVDIEVGRPIERRVPRSYPELEIVHPDF